MRLLVVINENLMKGYIFISFFSILFVYLFFFFFCKKFKTAFFGNKNCSKICLSFPSPAYVCNDLKVKKDMMKMLWFFIVGA